MTPSTRRSAHHRRYTSSSATDVGDHLEGQRVRAGRQFGLQAADQLHEERFDAEHPRRPAEREADGVRGGTRTAPARPCWGSSRAPRRSPGCGRGSPPTRPAWPLSAYETAPLDTPARRAMSAIVGRFTRAPRRFGAAPRRRRAEQGDQPVHHTVDRDQWSDRVSRVMAVPYPVKPGGRSRVCGSGGHPVRVVLGRVASRGGPGRRDCARWWPPGGRGRPWPA